MVCPNCGANDRWKIINSRMENDYVRRRRQCMECGSRISTIEVNVQELVKPKSKTIRRYFKGAVMGFLNEGNEKGLLK